MSESMREMSWPPGWPPVAGKHQHKATAGCQGQAPTRKQSGSANSIPTGVSASTAGGEANAIVGMRIPHTFCAGTTTTPIVRSRSKIERDPRNDLGLAQNANPCHFGTKSCLIKAKYSGWAPTRKQSGSAKRHELAEIANSCRFGSWSKFWGETPTKSVGVRKFHSDWR